VIDSSKRLERRDLPSDAAAGRHHDAAWLAAAFVLALALRAAFALTHAPIEWPDSRVYLESGLALLARGRIESDLVMPLYPMLVALAGWDGVRVLQVVATASLVFVVYGFVRSLTADRVAARLGALLIAVEPASIFYANQRLTESVFTVLLAAGLLALYRARPVLGSALLVGGLLVRPTFDLLLPVLIVAMAVLAARRGDGADLPDRRWIPPAGRWVPKAGRWLATYAAVYVVMMSPWWLHNHAKYGEFVRLNLGDGQVARLEQNATFVAHGFDWAKLRAVQKEFDGVADPIRRNAAYRNAAWDFAVADPLRYAGLALRRLGRFWSPVIDQSEPFTSRRIRWPVFAFTLVLYAGALGWLLTGQLRGQRRFTASPILLLTGYLTLVHVALHALVRYRFPLTPLLCALAAPGLVQFALGWPPARVAALAGSATNAAFSRSRADGRESPR
jgi:hypothetical protein